MNIGISWDAYGHGELSAEKQTELLLENGFTNTFTDSENPDVKTLVPFLRSRGIECDTFHAPFGGINEIWLDGEKGEAVLRRLIRSVNICAENKVPVMICHLSSGDDCPHITDTGYGRFSRLVANARENGVKIAFENQRKLANLAFAMEQFPEMGFCWDAGHEACFAYGREFMPLFGSRLIALHLHDNFAEHEGDMHMLPYDGRIDYEKAARHIAYSGFEGTVMLEVFRHTSGRYENFTPDEYYKRAGIAASKLRNRIEEIRKEGK